MMMMIKKTKDTDRANFDRGMKKMKIAMQTKWEWHFIITFLVPLMHNEVKLKVNDGPSFSVYASVAWSSDLKYNIAVTHQDIEQGYKFLAIYGSICNYE